MITFTRKILLFTIPVFLIFLLGLFLPPTPRASKSLLMASLRKNSLLKNTPSPRIIFVGGSNLSFGLNSKTIKDSLNLNPINTAIQGSIGIKFMMDNTLSYVQKGDIVVLVPEYPHYYRNLNAASEELMRTVFDVDLRNLQYFNIFQLAYLIPYLPKYCLTKFDMTEYFKLSVSNIYSVDSFNQFGDTFTHWDKNGNEFQPHNWESLGFNYEYNPEVIDYFILFKNELESKGATLFVSFPAFQESSFNNFKEAISKINNELVNSGLTIIGSPERYKMADFLMFDTPYHLNKRGVDYRTGLLIQDLKMNIPNQSEQ